MVCGKCKLNNTNAVCYCNSCFQNARIKSKEEGRVEGAIKELKLIIKKNSSFKYSRMDMIEFCEKRLKELKKGGQK